jgi:hypothetical protein
VVNELEWVGKRGGVADDDEEVMTAISERTKNSERSVM